MWGSLELYDMSIACSRAPPPSAFEIIQPGSESLKDGPIHDLGFSISLSMADRSESMVDVQLGAKPLEGSIVKLPAIIGDDGVG